MYLFCYFKGSSKDGLHLAYSFDGYKYTALRNDSSFLKPAVANDKLMRDPCIILLGSVPLAMVGAALPIFLWKTTLNIYSQIGLITLVGLIAKNGILIVEFANTLQDQGISKADAIRRAAATRLRPVLMTSAATVFGHLMLIFVTGPGAAARNSIGWVLVVGMAVGSVFTLYVVPAFYMLIARDRSKARANSPAGVPVDGALAKS